MPALPELDQPLSDGVVTLRPAAEGDIPEVLIAYQDDPGMHARLGEPKPPSGAQLGRRCERAEADRAGGVGVVLAIVPRGSEVCCGEVRVRDVDWEGRRARLMVWTAPQVRGHGIARRAVALAQQWLRTACGLAGSC